GLLSVLSGLRVWTSQDFSGALRGSFGWMWTQGAIQVPGNSLGSVLSPIQLSPGPVSLQLAFHAPLSLSTCFPTNVIRSESTALFPAGAASVDFGLVTRTVIPNDLVPEPSALVLSIATAMLLSLIAWRQHHVV